MRLGFNLVKLILILLAGTVGVLHSCHSPNEKEPGSEPAFLEYNNPPLVWLNDKERSHIPPVVDPQHMQALNDLVEEAKEALLLPPNPVDTLFYEGLVSNHPKRLQTGVHLQDMARLHTLTWAFLFTRKPSYGEKAIEIVSAWAGVYRPTGNDVNENKLDICFYAYEVFKDGLPSNPKEKIAAWLKEIARKQKEQWDPASGSSNRHIKRIKLIAMGGTVLEDDSLIAFAQSRIGPLLEKGFYADGTTRDLERRDALHYHMESIFPFLELAIIMRNTGIDLYTYQPGQGGSVQKSLAYVFPYVKGEKEHKEWVHTKIEFDKKRWEAGDPFYRPGKIWDRAEALPSLIIAARWDEAIPPLLEDVVQELPPLDRELRRLQLQVNCLTSNQP